MAVEMIFGIEIFKSEDDSSGNTTFVPLVFPLFAGAASFTTLLTLRSAGIAMINLALSIVLNMVLVYLVLRYVSLLDRILGKNGVYILRKFFGVVLLAISVKFITKNLIEVIAMVQHGVAAPRTIVITISSRAWGGLIGDMRVSSAGAARISSL